MSEATDGFSAMINAFPIVYAFIIVNTPFDAQMRESGLSRPYVNSTRRSTGCISLFWVTPFGEARL